MGRKSNDNLLIMELRVRGIRAGGSQNSLELGDGLNPGIGVHRVNKFEKLCSTIMYIIRSFQR